MEQRSIGFIGGGRITRIFLQAFKNKQFEPGNIKVYEINVRMIPNATSYINEGYNPLCFAGNFESDKAKLMKLLVILGKTIEVSVKKLEALAIISAMLPTYFWFQ